jgi:hypothetical protein
MAQGKRTDPVLIPSAEDIIYAAAFMDGEGCITVRYSSVKLKNGANQSAFASVTCSQADPYGGPVLKWFQERWGGSLRSKPEGKANARSAWEWCVVSHLAYKFIEDIRPWLKIKGPQADNALLVRELRLARGRGNAMTPEEIVQRQEIKAEAMRLNKRGI